MDRIERALELAETAKTPEDAEASVQELRRLLVVYGVAEEDAGAAAKLQPTPQQESQQKSRGNPAGQEQHLSQRARAWKLLLGVRKLDAEHYVELVRRGEHPRLGAKIRNDTFRTFKNCKAFEDVVPEARIVRVLNAFVHSYRQDEFTYVQGMNVICGVLLYVMPELDAFFCFDALITKLVPAYMSKNLDGVSEGCALFEECLRALDPQLADYLIDKMRASTQVYAFAPIMTLSACCPPLDSILHLWDIYFAAGVHLNIIFYASQMMLLRYELMDETNEMAKQYVSGRDFPQMDASRLIAVAFPFLFKLDPDLVKRLRAHARGNQA
ncbi:Cell division control protein 16 [Hondaea fermentalgiana]|uniref:Cell division control protein 16 n=1 Tax=Hondaea fermentalgiana TaxID=2315210 RepID=A0A2R5GAE1_9STRA|nr:Cell division control protein 16 [Hondaea fermentalgiana]|eukprot:GBG27980.1 Cell division control protein 16 [Hondaea fermentalgiana]